MAFSAFPEAFVRRCFKIVKYLQSCRLKSNNLINEIPALYFSIYWKMFHLFIEHIQAAAFAIHIFVKVLKA